MPQLSDCLRKRAAGMLRLTVDVQLRVADHLLDLSVLLEVVKGLACEGAVDLQAIDESSNGDETV